MSSLARRGIVIRSWTDVVRELRSAPGMVMIVGLDEVETPAAAGALRSIGMPAGQFEDWRFPPEADGAGLHVRRYVDRWIAHLDRMHPARDLPGHLMQDAPAAWVVGSMLGAGMLTYWGTRRPGVALAAMALAYVASLATAQPCAAPKPEPP